MCSLFKAKIFTVAAEQKVLVSTTSEVGAQAWLCVDSAEVFTNQFGILGLPETWITSDELCKAIFLSFKTKSTSTSVVQGQCSDTVLL